MQYLTRLRDPFFESIVFYPVTIINKNYKMVSPDIGFHIIKKDEEKSPHVTPCVLIAEDIGERIIKRGFPGNIKLTKNLVEDSRADVTLRWPKPFNDVLLGGFTWLDA